MSRAAALIVLALAAAACGSGSGGDGDERAASTTTTAPSTTTTVAEITTDPVFDVEVDYAVAYGTAALRDGDTLSLEADIYAPVAPGPRPGMIFIHGGAFVVGTRANVETVQFARAMAERGLVVASISYRLAPSSPVPSERVEPFMAAMDGPATDGFRTGVAAAVDDGLAALDWFVAHAEQFDVDPDRIFLGGESAGAITALHMAYNADEFGIETPPILAVVDLWGAIFLLPGDASAVDADEPPLFIVHGAADTIVPFEQGQLIADRAEAIGLRHEFFPVEGAGHAWGAVKFFETRLPSGESYIERIAAFLEAS